MKRPDRHNEIEVNLIPEGSITYIIGGSKVKVPSMRLILFWAAIPHQIIAHSANTPYFVITIPLVWFLQWQLPDSVREPVLHGQIVQENIQRSWDLESENAAQWCRDLETRSQERHEISLLEIEARIRRTALTARKRFNRKNDRSNKQNCPVLGTGTISKAEAMACYIAQNYKHKLTATEISASVHLHPNYAMALFKKTFNITVNEYLTQHRLSHAQRLLATSNDKILTIAFDSGFGTLSRFNEAFKSAFNCTPKHYRKTHRIHS